MGLRNYLKYRRFDKLERTIWRSVRGTYDDINQLAKAPLERVESSWPQLSDPLVLRGYDLRSRVMVDYKNRYRDRTDLRFLVHIPPPDLSPAGFSIFSNIVSVLQFMGIRARGFLWNDRIEDVLDEFFPSVFMTSDHEIYLARIDWGKVDQFRKMNSFILGLTASIEEYGNSSMNTRLAWAKKHRVDFYYSFRAPEYVKHRQSYRPFYDSGYPIINLEFGANPLIHYPALAPKQKVDYVLLASSNQEKWDRYFDFFLPIAKNHKGFVAGPGWSFCPDFNFRPECDRYIYSCGRVGINLSIENQVRWPCELNERTYILAACGVPQLIDNPMLLLDRFSKDSLFSASSPKEYSALFQYMLDNPEECSKRCLKALDEVFAKHTTFHRVEKFIQQLEEIELP